jgi:hypothetical protein
MIGFICPIFHTVAGLGGFLIKSDVSTASYIPHLGVSSLSIISRILKK